MPSQIRNKNTDVSQLADAYVQTDEITIAGNIRSMHFQSYPLCVDEGALALHPSSLV
jgi:hypothetical protein